MVLSFFSSYALECQYACVGILSGTLPATMYGYFITFRGVSASTYASMRVLFFLPWTFKFITGYVADNVSVSGLRRKPCLLIGWASCSVLLSALGSMNLFVKLNARVYATLMMIISMFCVFVDVSLDALMIRISDDTRDVSASIQSRSLSAKAVGSALGTLLVGTLMNSEMYGGSMSFGLTFEQVCLLLALMCTLSVGTVNCLPEHESWHKMHAKQECVVDILSKPIALKILMFQIISGLMSKIESPAVVLVRKYWAGVQPFHACVSSVIGNMLFVLGINLGRKCIAYDWRSMIIVSQTLSVIVDVPFQVMTVLGGVKNPYLYMSESILTELPDGVYVLVVTRILMVMSVSGNEALLYSLFTSLMNLGRTLGRAVSNRAITFFVPDVDVADNYIADDECFRYQVFLTVCVGYLGILISLVPVATLIPQGTITLTEHMKRSGASRAIGMLSLCTIVASLAAVARVIS